MRMIHIQQMLAHYWHLSAAQYLQLRLLCAIALGPLLGVLFVALFTKRRGIGSKVLRIKRSIHAVALRPAAPVVLPSTAI
jgi:hypothetical protein